MDTLRSLPSVHQLLEEPRGLALIAGNGRPLVRFAIQRVLNDERRHGRTLGDTERWNQIAGVIDSLRRPRLRPVINATGVVLHTNLGRAPLAGVAAGAAARIAVRYSTLEFDAATGRRGRRHDLVSETLQFLTGAEAAAVVNNCAAAVLLMLSALARGNEVIVGRGELIEIGGGFRMPDVMRLSGARMVEVGTTNRTRLEDYGAAINARTAAIMKVHASNFQLVGFTENVGLKALADLAHQRGVLLLHDLGSGSLLETSNYGLSEEPTVQSAVEAGADVVAASGDKLLGGPQAGILVGRADLLTRVLKHPLARAVRVDKLTLAALAATLDLYLTQAVDQIPVWNMVGADREAIAERARRWRQRLADAGVVSEVGEAQSAVGGGSLPGEAMPTTVLALTAPRGSAAGLLNRLRQHEPPVIGRIDRERVLLDPRTVLPDEDDDLIDAVVRAFA